jgi:hypothetical protein
MALRHLDNQHSLRALLQLTALAARLVGHTHIAYARLVPTAYSLSTPASGAADSQAFGGSTTTTIQITFGQA